ncbi:MAG: response regulator [Oscillospiraceae bacterium]|nr:response regulator [Oscillospiraceae bacterium]
MTILAVLENEAAQLPMTELLSAMEPEADLMCFGSALPALNAARQREVDIAVLDGDLPELSGLDFGQYLQELYPFVNLIYLVSDPAMGFEALRQHASGILMKPVVAAELRIEMDSLRYPIAKTKKRLFAQTFGNFELFCDGKPIVFKYTKTKEIVAILINNRGAQTTNGEIIATLWEDDGDPEKKTSYLSNLRQDLQNTFNRLRLNGIILKQRGSMAIATDRIECDLYDWLEKKNASQYHYLGDYMNQYSWPEVMHAELDEIGWSLDEV